MQEQQEDLTGCQQPQQSTVDRHQRLKREILSQGNLHLFDRVGMVFQTHGMMGNYSEEEMIILASGYCKAMQIGPTVPVYYLLCDFEKSMRRHPDRDQKQAFYTAFELEMKTFNFSRGPRVTHLEGKEIIEELESLDKDNTFRTVAHYNRYSRFKFDRSMQHLLHIRASRLLELRPKLREVDDEIWQIGFLWDTHHTLARIIYRLSNLEAITKQRQGYGIYHHQDSLVCTVSDKMKNGLSFIKTLFQNEKQC